MIFFKFSVVAVFVTSVKCFINETNVPNDPIFPAADIVTARTQSTYRTTYDSWITTAALSRYEKKIVRRVTYKAHLNKQSRRFLIINEDKDFKLRRQMKQGQTRKRRGSTKTIDPKTKKTEELLYKEYDEKTGELINEQRMRNLDDVKKFFIAFLEVEVCYEECLEHQAFMKAGETTTVKPKK